MFHLINIPAGYCGSTSSHSPAALFGSVARGQNTPDSDVDLVVSFGKKYDLLDIVGLKQDLEEALQVPFDVITYESLKSGAFADSVYTDERVIYG